MTENILCIEDEEEITRRSIPPPPAVFLAPPAFLETSADKENRQRQHKLIDEARKKREDMFEEYRDLFAKDFPTDLERAIENITPATTNVMTHYRVMKERLCNKFGPNSQKDAQKTRRKLEGLHGDHRGWDIYLAALDTLVEVLSTTPVCDTANNPVLQPVPVRPQFPIPRITASRTRMTTRTHSAHGKYSTQTTSI